MQYRQPMQVLSFTSTTPSSVENVAPTGQTWTHGGCAHWLHSFGTKKLRKMGLDGTPPPASDALAHRNPDPPQFSGGLLLRLPPRGEDPEESAQDAARQGEGGKELPEKRSTVHHSTSGRWGQWHWQ